MYILSTLKTQMIFYDIIIKIFKINVFFFINVNLYVL